MRIVTPLTALVLAVLSMAGAAPVSHATDIVTNGGFELGPAIPPSGSQAVAPGSTALTGWSVAGSSITIFSDSYWAPYSGHRSVALSASAPGTISQSFASTNGAAYRLTFQLSGEPFTSPIVKHLRVQAGSVTQDFAFDTSPAWHWDMAWTSYTIDFTGTGSSTALTFTSLDAGSWGPAIDSVRVEAATVGVMPVTHELTLAPVAPDPLRDRGRIAFTLPRAQAVRLSTFDVQGREIDRLVDGTLDAGPHELQISPRGASARSGLYFLVLRTDEHTLVRRFAVLR